MLLSCGCVVIAREFDFRVAGENIRTFQISDKSGGRLEPFQNCVANIRGAESAARSFESIVTPIDFKGGGCGVLVGGGRTRKSYEMNKC